MRGPLYGVVQNVGIISRVAVSGLTTCVLGGFDDFCSRHCDRPRSLGPIHDWEVDGVVSGTSSLPVLQNACLMSCAPRHR
jgi:hypothetical protein